MANKLIKSIKYPGLSNTYIFVQIGTEAGQAADAKVVGDEIATKVSKPVSSPNGTAGQLLRTNGDGTTQWVDQGLPTDEQTAEAIDEWLTNHPEATTTVQDGAITEAKLAESLKLKTIKEYVTPEMFGAVGDGLADDTLAVQSAIDTDKVVCLFKDYKITTGLYFGKDMPAFINYGTITYTGEDYAISFKPERFEHREYYLGKIEAPNGNILNIDASVYPKVYLDFHFLSFRAKSNTGICINAICNGSTSWLNEIRFHTGSLRRGSIGVNIENNGNYFSGHFLFDAIGFEGVETGVKISGTKEISKLMFSSCRMEETTQYLLDDVDSVPAENPVSWFGSLARQRFLVKIINHSFIFNSGILIDEGYQLPFATGVWRNGWIYGRSWRLGGQFKNLSEIPNVITEADSIETVDFKVLMDYDANDAIYKNKLSYMMFYIPRLQASTTEQRIYLDTELFNANSSTPYGYSNSNNFLLQVQHGANATLKFISKQTDKVLLTVPPSATTAFEYYEVSMLQNRFVIKKISTDDIVIVSK